MSAATLGTRVKAAREAAGLSMRGIDGVDNGLISRIESGKVSDPGIATMTAIARATGKTVDELMGAPASAVRMIELRELFDDPDNPRQIKASDAEDDALIESIRERGLILPLAVRLVEHEEAKTRVWAVVDGHRRLMALRAVFGPKSKQPVPCRVIEADDTNTQLLQLSANLLRADMNPWDLALAVARLVEKGVDTKTIAASVNRGRRWVQEQASVGKHLKNHAAVALANGTLSISQAVAIAGERDPDAQYFLTNRAISEKLTEDDIRALTADRKAQADASKKSEQVDIEDLLPPREPEEEKAEAPKPVGGWKTWRSEHGYFKWQLLKTSTDSWIVETSTQWRREGSTTMGWSALPRRFVASPAEALMDAVELSWDEYESFGAKKDKATFNTSLLAWVRKGLLNLGGGDPDLVSRFIDKMVARVEARFGEPKPATAPAKVKAPPKLPPVDISEPPKWALPMVGALFMYHTGRQAFLCKGWRQMAKTFSEQMDADQEELRALYERASWANDTEGQPFDFGGAVVRLVDAPQ